jgi:nucleoside-diphosphate-sugar epimerase
MKKVLLVGGAGYIGGLTCDFLMKAGFDVSVYDNLLYEDRFLKEIKFIKGDIRETSKLCKEAESNDIVVFMAALVGDPACSVDNLITESINYNAVKNFCDNLKGDKKIIFMSTCSVYGAQDGILDETSPTSPLSSYASTKLRAEKHILAKNGTVFRLGTVFGLGDTYSRLRMDLVVNILTMKAVKDKEITINGGDQWRPIIAVRDIANYVVEACDRDLPGIYVLSYKNTVIKELGEEIAKMIPGTNINYTEVSFQDARNYQVSNQKSLKDFDYKPTASVASEVSKMIRLFQDGRIADPEDKAYHNGAFLKSKKEKQELS